MLHFSFTRRISASRRCAPARHRLPYKRERLMAVQAAQLDDLAIQFESVIGELRLPKTDPPRILVDGLRPFHQPHMNRIQIRRRQVPQFDPAQIFQRVRCTPPPRPRSRRRRNLRRALRHHPIPVAQLNLNAHRLTRRFQALQKAVHLQLADARSRTSIGFAKMFSINVPGTTRSDTSR